ncbi:S8 family peptidase [Sphaerimonospora sp. CA-214678]|uniref:S8 family peptidase n=1 Tax=Sphaerimonospora sp. CA-214678 TaxID=3240029 RepID=UPI003D89B0F0
MTSNDKPKDGSESRSPASSRGRQPTRQMPHVVEPRPMRYMVAALRQPYLSAMGVSAQPLDADGLCELLENDPEVTVRRRLPGHPGRPARTEPQGRHQGPAFPATAPHLMAPHLMGTQVMGPQVMGTSAPFPEIVIVDMTAEHALELHMKYPQVLIERDRLLTYSEVPGPPRRRRTAAAVVPSGVVSTFTFLVRDGDGKPVPGATVFVTGFGWPAQGVTGADGRATVTLAGETPESIVSLVVKPRAGHWSFQLDRPSLSTSRDNLIELVKLSETFEGFPGHQLFGWGQQAMNLDRLPPTFRGAGVKVAVIDSGAAIDHPDLLNRISGGIDLSDHKPDGWAVDTAHHGSHCAAIIGGADDGQGVVGFAVEAEVHACKIFPGGRFSDLIEALDYCIEQRIDVVNLSLGSRHPSQLVAAKIEQAREAGVACVVAAGNDGGPVGFPGNLPTVLTVAAIGRVGTFPTGTAHAAEIMEPCTGEGYFSPRFTCHGPGVDVCAPGVAVLSAVPSGDYAVWDGTSMAAPHVTGLAALVLAHHPDLYDGYGTRDARRVERLFQIIKSSCLPLDLGDPGRTGAGLPNALLALGPALALITPELTADIGSGDLSAGGVQGLLDRLTAEMAWAGLLVPGPVDPDAGGAWAMTGGTEHIDGAPVAAGIAGDPSAAEAGPGVVARPGGQRTGGQRTGGQGNGGHEGGVTGKHANGTIPGSGRGTTLNGPTAAGAPPAGHAAPGGAGPAVSFGPAPYARQPAAAGPSPGAPIGGGPIGFPPGQANGGGLGLPAFSWLTEEMRAAGLIDGQVTGLSG